MSISGGKFGVHLVITTLSCLVLLLKTREFLFVLFCFDTGFSVWNYRHIPLYPAITSCAQPVAVDLEDQW